jgi:hypothetical protein
MLYNIKKTPAKPANELIILSIEENNKDSDLSGTIYALPRNDVFVIKPKTLAVTNKAPNNAYPK